MVLQCYPTVCWESICLWTKQRMHLASVWKINISIPPLLDFDETSKETWRKKLLGLRWIRRGKKGRVRCHLAKRLFASSLQHVTDDPKKGCPQFGQKWIGAITDVVGALFSSTDHLNYQKLIFSCLQYASLVTEFIEGCLMPDHMERNCFSRKEQSDSFNSFSVWVQRVLVLC